MSTPPSIAGANIALTGTLGSDADNQAQVEVRVITTNAVGNDEWVGVDDISITSSTLVANGATVSINDVTITEGNAGTNVLTFTVTRSNDLTAFSVDFGTADGTANAGSDYVAASGTLSFAAGDSQLSQQVSITVNGDTLVEANETFFVNLVNLITTTGTTTISDSSGLGTITNDDVAPVLTTAINVIQGAGHTSALVGQSVTTTGIVTAVGSNGFYLQTPDADIDANIATSEAIFIFTSTAPSVAVAQQIRVTGTVTEFIPGGAATGNLSTTQLVSPTGITVLSSGNVLPTAIILGTGGRVLPTANIDDDGLTSFDAVNDGIDFFESLEAMRVTIPSPLAVSGTNGFGEIFTVANGGANAIGLSARGAIIATGTVGNGLTVTNTGLGSDYNPERIQIDADNTITPGTTPNINTGTVLNDVTGVLAYNFGNFEVVPTSAITVAAPSALTQETTNLVGTSDQLTIAAFNVENLDPNDSPARIAQIGSQIANNLAAPDIIALQEIQDNNGAVNDSVIAANVTLQTLVNAIVAAGGPTYTFIDNPFITDDTNGGEPGGNIRVAYLYNASRVSLVAGSLQTTPNAATDFNGSRRPLVATFSFNGEDVTVVNNHFTSKGGGTPLYGATQPSINGGASQRLVQAQNVANFVDSLGPNAKVIVLGDLNEFANEESLAPLAAVGLKNLGVEKLPEAERYSFVFDGNAQELDQAYVSANLLSVTQFDIAHLNAEFADTFAGRTSDHDPSVIAISFAAQNSAPMITSNGGGAAAAVSVAENTTAVTTVTATDADTGATAAYSISGGVDAALFSINAATGVLSFVTAPNFEVPADAGGDGVYDVTVRVSDGTLTDTQAIAVIVTNINEAPVIDSNGGGASAAVSIAENSFAITTVHAADPDEGDTVTYSISGGADAALFQINATTGGLSFISAPDFETPADASAGNVYDVIVAASDGSLNGTQAIAVTVTNVFGEARSFTGTAGADVFDATPGDNWTILGLGGDDALTGSDGNDTLDGGTGNNTLDGDAGYDIARLDFSDRTQALVLVNGGEASVTYAATVGGVAAGSVTDIEALSIIGGAGDDRIGGVYALPTDGSTVSLTLDGSAGTDTAVLNFSAASVLSVVSVSASTIVFAASDADGALTVTASSFEAIELVSTPTSGSIDLSLFTGNIDVRSGAGNDTLRTGSGNDTLSGGSGNDSLYGGAGDDTAVISGPSAAFRIASNVSGQFELSRNSGLGGVTLLSGIEHIRFTDVTIDLAGPSIGTALNDVLSGTAGNDLLQGFAGNDTLNGFAGNDTLDGGTGRDQLSGGTGDDTYIVDASGDRVIELLNEGTDIVLTGLASYRLADNVENLTFNFSETAGYRGLGNVLANAITGSGGIDTLYGYEGNDTLSGMGGNDTLVGGDGNDVHDGGTGADLLIGGLGDDLFIVDNIGDVARGESTTGGFDRVESSVTFTLGANIENLMLTGTAASNGTGSRDANMLLGNGADNILSGLGGNDTLIGGAGNDTLRGGLGTDTLTGGIGADTFVFDTRPNTTTNVDVVTDFTSADGDKFAFSKAIFTTLGDVGNLGTDAFYVGNAAHDATDRIIYNQATGSLFYDADGTGSRAQVLIATIGDTVHPALTFGDFLILA